MSLVRNKVSSRRRFNIVKAPLVAVWAKDQGRTTVPTHQLEALLTEGERDAMAESALKGKGETPEGQ